MKKNMSWQQLARFFAGELSLEEKKKMEIWIKADVKREEYVKRLYGIWKESENLPYKLNVDDAWSRLSGDMDKMEEETEQLNLFHPNNRKIRKLHGAYFYDKKNQRPGHLFRRISIAVAMIAIISTAGFFTYYSHDEHSRELMAEMDRQVFTTQEGERASYILGDGSRVILHAGSRLEVPDNYNEDTRELFLEGEAYFETAHDPDRPFIVHSKDTYTHVVGTRFLVQAWPDFDQSVEVIVSEGKVLFGDNRAVETDNKKEVLLAQNQRGILTRENELVVTEVVDMDWFLGWTEGRLIFENRPLSEVLPRLERWYDISLTVADERISEEKITAEIDYNLPMSDVLQGIALSLDLELERTGRAIIFR